MPQEQLPDEENKETIKTPEKPAAESIESPEDLADQITGAQAELEAAQSQSLDAVNELTGHLDQEAAELTTANPEEVETAKLAVGDLEIDKATVIDEASGKMNVVGEQATAAAQTESKEAEREASASDQGLVNEVRKFVNSRVQESKLPTKEGLGYESTVGVYGGKLDKDEQGKLVYDTRGFWSKVDQWGDRVLRAFDEHHAQKPGAMFLRHPGEFLKMLPLVVDSKRYRGTPEQTMDNVKRFGLEDYYGAHPWGIEIKDQEAFSHALGLQDIFRSDLIDHPALADIDRFQALGAAAGYMHTLHDTVGGMAEGNAYSFLFTEKKDGQVAKPIIMIPTMVYNPEKHVPPIEQKATDLLDLLASAAVEEYRRSQSWENIRKAFTAVFDNYQDKKVIAMVASYVKRGRLTLPGDLAGLDFETSPTYNLSRKAFAAHNTQRLNVTDPEATPQIRRELVEACQRYLGNTAGEKKGGEGKNNEAELAK